MMSDQFLVKMNLIWFNRAKHYCNHKEDPKFYRVFKWIQKELGLIKGVDVSIKSQILTNQEIEQIIGHIDNFTERNNGRSEE